MRAILVRQQKENDTMTKTYISLDDLSEIITSPVPVTGESIAALFKSAKTLDDHQVAEIEAMRGYVGHSLIEDNDYNDDEYLDWFVGNELEEYSFKSKNAFLEAHKELADAIRIEAVGAYFVAIYKNA